MNRVVVFFFLALIPPVAGATGITAKDDEIYQGWLSMYDLKFEEAHRVFAACSTAHPDNPLGPASDAAAYLFSELARLGSLESELFVDDMRFTNRKKLTPDPTAKAGFAKAITQADELADAALKNSSTDANALFVKSLVCGLRADYASLVDKENLAALAYTKQGRPYADKLLSINPQFYDAYLGLGVENYLLSLKSAPIRVFLRIVGSHIDREKGLEQLRLTSEHGHYFEPFAKLLLAVAALRDKHPEEARSLLAQLHDRFPDNPLYQRELGQLTPAPL